MTAIFHFPKYFYTRSAHAQREIYGPQAIATGISCEDVNKHVLFMKKSIFQADFCTITAGVLSNIRQNKSSIILEVIHADMTWNQPFLSLKAVVLFSGFSLVCQNVKSVGGGGPDFDSSGFFRSMSWKWFEVVSVIVWQRNWPDVRSGQCLSVFLVSSCPACYIAIDVSNKLSTCI